MRNAIVTGGSRGLGLGIVRKLAAAGFRAIVVARRESEELRAARGRVEAGAGSPDPMPFVPCDLSEVGGLPDLVSGLRKRFGPIYALVNNAGASTEGLLAMAAPEEIERVVRLNTLAPLLLTRQVVRAMMADGGGGRIVNMASVTAFTGYSGLAAYSATKASLVGWTRSLAREVGRLGITVNAVAPGFVRTEMTAGMGEDEQRRMERRAALKRLVEVEDVAHAVEFLLGDGARSITGTVLTVDAGSTA